MIRNMLLGAAMVAGLAAFAEVKAEYPVRVYDFGAFAEEDGDVTCRFPVVNTGDEPLAIISARATCGCTTPSFPRESIAPGDTAYVTVTYNPSYRPGKFSKYVHVETTATPPKMKLEIKGTVIGAERSISHRYPADFGPLKLEHPKVMLGELLNTESNNTYIHGYNQSADSLTVAFSDAPSYMTIVVSPDVVPPGEIMSAVFFVDGDHCGQFGLIEDEVTMTVNGTAHKLPTTLVVGEDFSKLSESDRAKAPVAKLSAESVDFGTVSRTSDYLPAQFTITNAGQSTLKIRRVYSADAGVEASVDKDQLKPGETATVDARLSTAQQNGGLINARVNVISNDPGHPSQTVRLVGQWQ